MSTAAWLAWSVLVVAVVIDMIAIVLEQRRVTRIFGEVDNLNAVVFGVADDINVREAIVDLQADVVQLTVFVTQQDDEPSTGRHAHTGEMRTTYVPPPTTLEISDNPTAGLWDKRNTSSGHFEAAKRSGDVFKGVRREN